jgi:hypothetical protein
MSYQTLLYNSQKCYSMSYRKKAIAHEVELAAGRLAKLPLQ